LETNDIVFGSWYYFALTYDEARDPNSGIWYLGPAGQQLKSGFTTNSPESVAGGGLGLFVGNRSTLNGAYRSPGNGRIDEFAIWARELSSTEVSNQFARLPQPPPPGATYRQIVQSQFPTYYFRLDNSLLESVGSNLLLSAAGSGGAFTNDFLGVADWAYSFSATNDALFVTNDLIPGGGPGQNTLATGKGSISFQFRMLSDTNNTGQRFIFSAPGSEATSTDDNMLALYLENSDTTNSFPGSLKLRVGNLTKGSTGSSTPENNVPIAFATNLVPNAWYYFAMTYDEARNTPEVYTYFGQAGGTLISDIANPANASVVGDNGWLVLGNKREISAIVDNAFRGPGSGVIDEFAIWQDELGPAEIQAQFAAMVAPVEPPTLGIALTGGNVVLSWTTEGTAGFELESTTSLSTPSWTGAGTPTVVEDMNYVTNSVAGNGTYYRLSKPKQ
jgi:hypothetical protein